MTETLIEISDRHSKELRNRLAFVFLSDGNIESARLTYSQLDLAARAWASVLAERVEPGERALLVYEAGLDFVIAFFACLYSGLVAVPLPAPEASRLKAGLRRLD